MTAAARRPAPETGRRSLAGLSAPVADELDAPGRVPAEVRGTAHVHGPGRAGGATALATPRLGP